MKYLSHLHWAIPVVLVGAVLWQVFVSTTPLTGTTNFVTPTPYFDVLLPASRVSRSPAGLALLTEPVYVDVRLPLRVASVELELTTTADSAALRLGVQQGKDFAIVFPDVAAVKSDQGQSYRLKVTDFSFLRPRHTLRFVLSAPGLKARSIQVTGASVRFERAPFGWNSL